jgi:GTP cyclohydrolase II
MVWSTKMAASVETIPPSSDRLGGAVRLGDVGLADRSHEVVRAIADLRRGDVVLLRDKADVALILAAETIDEANLARAHAVASLNGQFPSGLPMLATTGRRAMALGLETTGIGAATDGKIVILTLPSDVQPELLRELADPTMPRQPMTAKIVATAAEEEGFAPAAIELAKLARLLPAVLILPVLAREAALVAERSGIITVSAAQARHHRSDLAHSLRRVAEAKVPLVDSHDTRIVAFRPDDGGIDHLAILIGTPEPGMPVLTRIHSECFTGDLLGSLRCDCGEQLRGAIKTIAESGSGVLIYLAQEGRGIGLINKLRAYTLQDAGFDTVDANMQLGFDADERIYQPAAEILRQLGFDKVRLMTNNPEKLAALTQYGIEVVDRVPHAFPANQHNRSYLETKARRSGHLF